MSQTEEEYIKNFLDDVKDHKIEIISDNGITRHIRFKNKTSIHYFDLVTWENYLAISGDMGDWVFKRLGDMFCFFRNEKGELKINLGYWTEKLVSVSKWGSSEDNTHKDLDLEETCKELSSELHHKIIDIYEDCPDCSSNLLINKSLCSSCSEIVEELRTELFRCENIRDIQDFCEDNDIEEWYESLCHEPTMQYKWCLHAIAWGVIQYDKYKEENE